MPEVRIVTWQACIKRVWRGGGLIACMLAPALGYAQMGVRECTLLNGDNTVTFTIPPSVNFSSDSAPIAGSFLYLSRPYEFQYRCINNAPGLRRVAIVVQGDYAPLRQALRDASLRLDIVYDNLQLGSWNPDPLIFGHTPFFSVDAPYEKDTGVRLGRIFLMLFSTERVTTPLRVYLPATMAFRMIPDETATAAPGIYLNSRASRFQYIPQCIGSVNVDNTVQFDTILTTSNFNGKLPQTKRFNLTTQVNNACPGIAGLVAPPGPISGDEFYVRTLVSFLPQSGERVDLMDDAIYLKNANGQENGLKLSITNAANQTIKFGPIPVDTHGEPSSAYYTSNLGVTLHGTSLALTQTYTARLERSGAELKTGKYSAQVLVKVAWF